MDDDLIVIDELLAFLESLRDYSDTDTQALTDLK